MDISIDTILAVIGLILSMYFGYLGIKYAFKFRKKPEIIFLKNTSISLFKTIVKNLDDIEINFQGKKIQENLILFKGTFFNNGNVDIEKSVIHKPIEIELPNNYNWVSFKIIDTSEDLDVKIEQNNNKLIFNWDLLKEGEFFTFDSLLEYKPEDQEKEVISIGRRLLKDLKISHRITDLKSINKENSIRKPFTITGLIFFSIFLLGFVSATFYLSFGQLLFPKYQLLNEVAKKSRPKYIYFEAKDPKTLTIFDKNKNEIELIKKSDLQTYITGKTIIVKAKLEYISLIAMGLFSILYFIMWVLLLVIEIRSRKLYNKLKQVAQKHNDSDFENRVDSPLKFLLLTRSI